MVERFVTLTTAVAFLTVLAQSGYADSVTLGDAKLVGDETINSPIGEIELQDNFITDESVQKLFDEMDYQRAAQAYIWSTPAVSYKQWQVAQDETFGATNLGDFVVYLSLKEKRGIVTANLTTPYVINFLSLANGPIVVEVPKAEMAGMFLDLWQRPIADIGQTGPDKGQGATYIVVGPESDASEYEGQADFVIQSETNNIFIGVRILDTSRDAVGRIRQDFRAVSDRYESWGIHEGLRI